MPDVVLVASDAQPATVRDLGRTLAFELERQGMPATLSVGRFPAPRPDRVFVLLDPTGYVATEGRAALPPSALLRRTVFVCDQVPALTGETDPVATLLARGGAVFAQDRRDVVALHRVGIPARLLRPGYSASRDRYDPAAPRPLDVIVPGVASPRRRALLARAAPVLARRRCLIEVADIAEPASALGEQRLARLAEAKIALLLNDGGDERAPFQTILDAIHAGAVVVAEHAAGLAPLEPGQHLLVGRAGALPYVAERLLADPDRLARLRQQAYERLSAWIPYALPVSVLRAAIVELVGEPLSDLTGELDAAARLVNRPARAASAAETAPARRSPAASPRSVAVCDSPAWAAQPRPAVSVVCTLDADGSGEAARGTLDTVAAAGRTRDLELIIVHGERDPAGAAVASWCDARPRLASRRIALAGRPSLAAARHAAASVARAPACLLVSAGDALYPRSVAVLTEALEAGAERVYPLLELTGGLDDGPSLGNLPGAEPTGPVLVRTAALRDAAGDLEPHAPGVLVPEILARRAG